MPKLIFSENIIHQNWIQYSLKSSGIYLRIISYPYSKKEHPHLWSQRNSTIPSKTS